MLLKIWIPWHALGLINLLKGLLEHLYLTMLLYPGESNLIAYSCIRLPSLAVSTPELMARTKDAVSDCMLTPNFYFTAVTEFVASLAIVQLLLRSTDVVLGKVDIKEILRKLEVVPFLLALKNIVLGTRSL